MANKFKTVLLLKIFSTHPQTQKRIEKLLGRR